MAPDPTPIAASIAREYKVNRLGRFIAEEHLDLGNEKTGGAAKAGFHSIEVTKPDFCFGPETTNPEQFTGIRVFT